MAMKKEHDSQEKQLTWKQNVMLYLHDGVYLLSVRTMEEKDFAYVAEAVSEAMNG